MSLLSLITPKQMVNRIWEVDPAALARAGIRGLVLDLDNTLSEWNRAEFVEGVEGWLAKAREAGLALCIASNTSGAGRVQAMAQQIGAHCIVRAGKPRRRAYLRAAESMGTSPETTAVIGDQVFTDILGGNRAGMTTILVRPFNFRDFPATKLMRIAEWILLGVLRRRAGGVGEESGNPCAKRPPSG
jgi:HAD superfamily phosphatase (TIGR01668 family)